MNSDTIAGNWKQLKGKVKEQWGDLTDDDLTIIDGKLDVLSGSCLLYTSPSPRDRTRSRMPSSA